MTAPSARPLRRIAAAAAAWALALSCCIPDHDEPLCLGGTSQCGERCVSLAIDPGHCGTCGNACGPDEVCRDGACSAPCGAGLTICEGQCVTLSADHDNCGACGAACEPDLVCVQGSCADDCFGDSLRCGDVCVDPAGDHDHCGRCDQPCAAAEACTAGECKSACGDGLSCGAQCVDPKTDSTNCGTCGYACLGGRACALGSCQPYCGPKPCMGCEAWWAIGSGPVYTKWSGVLGTKAVATSPEGRVFVALDFIGELSLGTKEYTATTIDIAVMELDPKGGVLWSQQIGGSGTDHARSLAVLDAGRLVLAGEFGLTLTMGAQVLTSAGLQDGFVAALSSVDGTPQWATRLGSVAHDRIISVAVSTSSVVVGGAYGDQAALVASDGTSTALPAPAGLDDAFVARLDPDLGVPIWATGFGADQADAINDVALVGGAVLVAGSIARDTLAMPPAPVSVQIGPFTVTHQAKVGALLAALSEADGAAQWASVLSNESAAPNGSQAEGSALAVAPDGNVWVLGRYAGTLTLDGGQLGSTAGSYDGMLVRIEPSGKELGGWSFGGVGTEALSDLAIDDAGRIVATGAFTGEMKFAELGAPKKKLTAAGAGATYDVWMASFDPPAGKTSPPTLRCARSFGDAENQAAASLSVRQGVAYVGGRFIGTIDLEPGISLTTGGELQGFVAAFGY